MSTYVVVFIAAFICSCIPLVHAPRLGLHIANQDDLCEVYIDESSSCYLQRNVGDRVDLRIVLSGLDLEVPTHISWYRKLKIHHRPSMLVNLNDTGHLPRNMELSPDGLRLTIRQLREYDMSGNGLKVWLHGWLQLSQSRSVVNFVIEPLPIDLGDPPLGQPLSMNIADYFTIPEIALYAVWHKESLLPETTTLEALLSEGGGHFQIKHLTREHYGIYACEVYSRGDYFLGKKRFQIGDVDTALSLHHYVDHDHPTGDEEYTDDIMHHRQIVRQYDQQIQPHDYIVSIRVADPQVCSYHLPSSHLCIIGIPMMLMGSCDLWLKVNITGPYRVDEVVWLKYWAKVNRLQTLSNQFEAEEVTLGISADGRSKQVWCDEGDFLENYYSVQVRNGNIPPPSFTFKLIQEPIELGPLVLGHPYELNTNYYGLNPQPEWIGKWVHEETGNFTLLEPPHITHVYKVDQLGIHDVGLLTFFAYEDYNGYQVATRRFHSEADIDECSTGLHSCPDIGSYCKNMLGSYECLCAQGFVGDGHNCADVNECADPSLYDCDINADCVNTAGSYYCACHSGYHGNGVTCDPESCPLLEEVLNGRVEMQGHSYGDVVQFTCDDGYKMDGSGVLMCLEMGLWSGSMPRCYDIDECEGINECSVNADCTNTPGSYECDCEEGYEGNGITCQDVDECSFEVSPCPSHTKCTNIEGGYSCTCFHKIGEEGKAAECQGSSFVYTYEDVMENIGSNVNVFYESYYDTEIGHLKEDNADYAAHGRTAGENEIIKDIISSDKTIDNKADMPVKDKADTTFRVNEFDNYHGGAFISNGMPEDLPPLVAGNKWPAESREGVHRGKRDIHPIEEYVYVKEGTTYHLPCLPASMDTTGMVDTVYQWASSDDKPLIRNRYFILENGDLQIVGVVPQDSGVVTCDVSYGVINSGMVQRQAFSYVLTVYSLPLIITSVSVNYHASNCRDNYDNNIWQEIFKTAIRIEICKDDFCDLQDFDTECVDVQEEQKQVGYIMEHELVFTANIRVNNKDLEPCSMTCMVRQLYDHAELIIGKLERYVEKESGQLASYPSLGFHVVKGSLRNQVELACAGGHGLHDDVCVACEPGTFSPSDAMDCTQCDKGSYEPEYAASACKPCPSGHYSYHPGAKGLHQCHAKVLLITSTVGVSFVGLVVLLVLAFMLYKIVKKCLIKSHGVKLPGLDLSKDVDLLANMHDVDDRTHRKKTKKHIRWGSTRKLSTILEEHVPLIADVESPPQKESEFSLSASTSEQEITQHADESHTAGDVPDEGSRHVVLQLVDEDEDFSQSSLVTEEQDSGEPALTKTRSVKEMKRPSHFESDQKRTSMTGTDEVKYANLDHSRRSSSHMSPVKRRSQHKHDLDMSPNVSATSGTVSSSSGNSSSSNNNSSSTGVSTLEAVLEEMSSSSSSASSMSRGTQASATVVSETTEEHVPIFPSEKTDLPAPTDSPPTETQQSHTVLMLDSPSKHTSTEFATGQRGVSRTHIKELSPQRSLSSIRPTSSRQTRVSSLQHLSPRHSLHLIPPSDKSPTVPVSRRSQEQFSPKASSSVRHIESPRKLSSLQHLSPRHSSDLIPPLDRSPTVSVSRRSQEQFSPKASSSIRHIESPRKPSSAVSVTSHLKSPVPSSPTYKTPSISRSVDMTSRRTSSKRLSPLFSPPRSTTHLPTQKTSSAIGEAAVSPSPPSHPDSDILLQIKSTTNHRGSLRGMEAARSRSSGMLSPPPGLSIPVSPLGRSTSSFQHQMNSRHLSVDAGSTAVILDKMPSNEHPSPPWSPVSPAKVASIQEHPSSRQVMLENIKRLSSEEIPKEFQHQRNSRHLSVDAGSTALIVDEMPSDEHPGPPRSPVSPAKAASLQEHALSRQAILGDIRGLSSEEVRTGDSKSPSLSRTTSQAIGSQAILQDITDFRKNAIEDVPGNLPTEGLGEIQAVMSPAPPPPAPLEQNVSGALIASSSTGRAALFVDTDNLRREDSATEDVPTTVATTPAEVQQSMDRLLPPPSSKPSSPPSRVQSSSTGRVALFVDTNGLRKEDSATENVSTVAATTLTAVQKSTDRLPPLPSSNPPPPPLGVPATGSQSDVPSGPPAVPTSMPPTPKASDAAPPAPRNSNSSGGGALLGGAQKRRSDYSVTGEVSPPNEAVKEEPVPPIPPKLDAEGSGLDPPGSPGRDALLKDVQRLRRESTPSSNTNQNCSARLLPPSRPPTPVAVEAKSSIHALTPSSSSPGKQALLKDIYKIRDGCVTEGTPSKNDHDGATEDFFSCSSEFETSPPKKADGSPPPPPRYPPPLPKSISKMAVKGP